MLLYLWAVLLNRGSLEDQIHNVVVYFWGNCRSRHPINRHFSCLYCPLQTLEKRELVQTWKAGLQFLSLPDWWFLATAPEFRVTVNTHAVCVPWNISLVVSPQNRRHSRPVSIFIVIIIRGFLLLDRRCFFLGFTQTMVACFIIIMLPDWNSTSARVLFLRAVSENTRASIKKENIYDCFFKTRLCTDGKRRKTKAEFWNCAAEPTLFLPVWGPNTRTCTLPLPWAPTRRPARSSRWEEEGLKTVGSIVPHLFDSKICLNWI